MGTVPRFNTGGRRYQKFDPGSQGVVVLEGKKGKPKGKRWGDSGKKRSQTENQATSVERNFSEVVGNHQDDGGGKSAARGGAQ